MKFLAAVVVTLALQACAAVDKPKKLDYDPDFEFPFVCGMYTCGNHH